MCFLPILINLYIASDLNQPVFMAPQPLKSGIYAFNTETIYNWGVEFFLFLL
jgi:hypothetical protein